MQFDNDNEKNHNVLESETKQHDQNLSVNVMIETDITETNDTGKPHVYGMIFALILFIIALVCINWFAPGFAPKEYAPKDTLQEQTVDTWDITG